MNTFDLIQRHPKTEDGRGVEVLFQNDHFKSRLIVLDQGGSIPPCDMSDYVMFYVVEGTIQLTKDDETMHLQKHQLFITEPSVVSMKSKEGARIMGIQIKKS